MLTFVVSVDTTRFIGITLLFISINWISLVFKVLAFIAWLKVMDIAGVVLKLVALVVGVKLVIVGACAVGVLVFDAPPPPDPPPQPLINNTIIEKVKMINNKFEIVKELVFILMSL